MMNLQELAKLLDQLGIKSEFIAYGSDNYHTRLEKGNNPPHTCKYHAYTDKGEFVSWYHKDYIAFRVGQ